MATMTATGEGIDRAGYKARLEKFDSALCEAIAVSQASAGRYPLANVAYASRVFTQMCGAGVSLIRAAPLTRWARSEFEDWRFGSVAGHARSLLDGFLLFSYLMEPTDSEAELQARINVMHLNDCTRRFELLRNIGLTEDLQGLEEQRAELQEGLVGNEHFKSLPPGVQKNCMNGRFLTIDTRDEMLAKVGFEKGQFDAIYDLWSQHVHILPISFYRIESNGRGTGLENHVDRSYFGHALEVCTAILVNATDMVVAEFPDVTAVRQGVKSMFSPGPAKNRPRKMKAMKPSSTSTFLESAMSAAVKNSLAR